MTLTLTVIGCAGTNPSRDRVCSSYLVAADGYRLLLDCGHGALHRLQSVVDVSELDAVLISHLHADHFADLYGLNYALRFHPDQPPPVPVYAPAGAREFIGQLLPEESLERMGTTLDFRVAAAGDRLTLGPLTVELFRANHPIETLASRITAGRQVLAYTADTAPTDDLLPCARDADLLLADCTWSEAQRPLPEGVHCTGLEAGRLAAAADARRLLVTHVSPYNDPAAIAAEAAQAYSEEILVAADLQEITL